MSPGRPRTNEVVDAMVLAARGEVLSRRFAIDGLERLAEVAVPEHSTATLQAHFQLVDGRCGIDGRVTAVLRATCQRCLRPMDIAIDDRFYVILVRSEDEMSGLADTQDAIVANAEHFDLAWLTEEQLLLGTPLVPLHAVAGDCSPTRVAEPLPESDDKTQRPFAQLRELMNKR